MSTATTEDRFVGLAFPVVRVRFAGQTDSRGSRYVASIDGVRVSQGYDDALSPSVNAHAAAHRAWEKRRAQLLDEFRADGGYGEDFLAHFEEDTRDRVFIPGDLDATSYAFTVVPSGYLGDA